MEAGLVDSVTHLSFYSGRCEGKGWEVQRSLGEHIIWTVLDITRFLVEPFSYFRHQFSRSTILVSYLPAHPLSSRRDIRLSGASRGASTNMAVLTSEVMAHHIRHYGYGGCRGRWVQRLFLSEKNGPCHGDDEASFFGSNKQGFCYYFCFLLLLLLPLRKKGYSILRYRWVASLMMVNDEDSSASLTARI